MTERSRPHCTVALDRVDEERLGAFLQTMEFQTAFVGEMPNIDAFNQEGVELAGNSPSARWAATATSPIPPSSPPTKRSGPPPGSYAAKRGSACGENTLASLRCPMQ